MTIDKIRNHIEQAAKKGGISVNDRIALSDAITVEGDVISGLFDALAEVPDLMDAPEGSPDIRAEYIDSIMPEAFKKKRISTVVEIPINSGSKAVTVDVSQIIGENAVERREFVTTSKVKYEQMTSYQMQTLFSRQQNFDMCLALLIRVLGSDSQSVICQKIGGYMDEKIPYRLPEVKTTNKPAKTQGSAYAEDYGKETKRPIPDPLPGISKITGSKSDVRRLDAGYNLRTAMHMTADEMAKKFTKAKNRDMVLALGLSPLSNRGGTRLREDTEIMLCQKIYDYFRGK